VIVFQAHELSRVVCFNFRQEIYARNLADMRSVRSSRLNHSLGLLEQDHDLEESADRTLNDYALRPNPKST